MNGMKKIIAIAIIILGIPTIAIASWWNPTTWFDKSEVIEVPAQFEIPQIEVTEEIPKEVSKTEYITNETVKYVTIDNTKDVSGLLAQIDALNSQLATLQTQNTCPNEEYRQSLLSQIADIETRIAEIDFEIRDYPNTRCCVNVMPMSLQTPLLNERAELELNLVLLYNDLNTL